jgi:hypothetical protein
MQKAACVWLPVPEIKRGVSSEGLFANRQNAIFGKKVINSAPSSFFPQRKII